MLFLSHKSIEKKIKMVYTKHSGDPMKKYWIKKILSYTILAFLLVVATQLVYQYGKQSYQNYVDDHEGDMTWVENNIVLEDDYTFGSPVKVVRMPENLTVSEEDYQSIIEKKIKELLVHHYSIESPLLIYDPYREKDHPVYLYFHTGEAYSLEYFISTESIAMQELDSVTYDSIADEEGNPIFTNRHYYRLDTLVPGKKNNIILRLLDEEGTVIDAENFILTIP